MQTILLALVLITGNLLGMKQFKGTPRITQKMQIGNVYQSQMFNINHASKNTPISSRLDAISDRLEEINTHIQILEDKHKSFTIESFELHREAYKMLEEKSTSLFTLSEQGAKTSALKDEIIAYTNIVRLLIQNIHKLKNNPEDQDIINGFVQFHKDRLSKTYKNIPETNTVQLLRNLAPHMFRSSHKSRKVVSI